VLISALIGGVSAALLSPAAAVVENLVARLGVEVSVHFARMVAAGLLTYLSIYIKNATFNLIDGKAVFDSSNYNHGAIGVTSAIAVVLTGFLGVYVDARDPGPVFEIIAEIGGVVIGETAETVLGALESLSKAAEERHKR
jgi:hypothetical protein